MNPSVVSHAVRQERPIVAEAATAILRHARCILPLVAAAENLPRFLFNLAVTNRSIAAIAIEK
jgi:hypothetical protein